MIHERHLLANGAVASAAQPAPGPSITESAVLRHVETGRHVDAACQVDTGHCVDTGGHVTTGRHVGLLGAFLVAILAVAAAGCAPSARAPGSPGTAPLPAGGTAAPGTDGPAGAGRSGGAGESGGSGAPAGAGARMPATLAAGSSPACLESIEAVAERASGNRVLLGPAAFASSDELVLTRAIVRGPDGHVLDGRMPAPAPIVLKLSQLHGQCLVTQAPAGTSSLSPSTPAESKAPLVVTEPVALPACRCEAAQH